MDARTKRRLRRAGLGLLVVLVLANAATYVAALTTVNHRFEERNVPAFPLSPFLVFWGGWRQGFDAFAHNPVDYARRGRTPSLLLNGANDAYVTRNEARAIASALDARGRLVLCPGIGHASCLRGQADLWRDSVGTFLDTVLAQK